MCMYGSLNFSEVFLLYDLLVEEIWDDGEKHKMEICQNSSEPQ